MNRLFTILLFLLAAFIFTGCVSKRLTKKGAKMEQAGLYEQAADFYYQAYTRKNTNIDARLGLKRSGQMVLEKKLTAFKKSYNESKNQEAVYLFLEADKYYQHVTATGVELNFPDYYRDYYNEVKGVYLEDKYYEAMKLLKAENFGEAERLLREIIKLQPEYKDASSQLNIAVYEPLYREAIHNMDYKKYRTAYYIFDRIIKEYGNYKESQDFRVECLNRATISIAVAPVESFDNNTTVSGILETKIINEIKALNNPFLRVVEYSAGTKAQNINSAQELNASSSKPKDVDVVLICEIAAYSISKGDLNKEEKRGYLRKDTKVKDEEGNIKTITEYEKVIYYEYKMGRSVKISYSYKLADSRTSELYFADSKTLISADNIYYADYGGDKGSLVPGYWKTKRSESPEDVIHNGNKDISELKSLLESRRVIKTISTLETELFNAVATQISSAVNEYDPEK